MPRQTHASRRQLLKTLGAAGLALTARDALALVPPPFPPQKGSQPQRAGASHSLVRAAVAAAAESELGRRRVPLRLDISEAYVVEREAGRAGAVETAAVAITDKATLDALVAHLKTFKLKEPIGSRAAFAFIRAEPKGGARPQAGINFVLALSATDDYVIASIIRVAPELRGRMPGWVTVKLPRRPPKGAGGKSGGAAPVVSAVAPAGEDAGADEAEAFIACLANCLSTMMVADLGTGGPTVIETCAPCIAALAVAVPTAVPTVGITAFIATAVCLPCAGVVGGLLALCALDCSNDPSRW